MTTLIDPQSLHHSAWRPLKAVNVVPLVISDRQTVVQEDLVERDIVLPDKIVKAYFVKYRPYHKWYYMSSQTPEDVAIFTTWDSAEIETVASEHVHCRLTYHTHQNL